MWLLRLFNLFNMHVNFLYFQPMSWHMKDSHLKSDYNVIRLKKLHHCINSAMCCFYISQSELFLDQATKPRSTLRAIIVIFFPDSLGYTIRQSCVADTCRTYSAFRFKASCYRGYCQCNGKDYQRETCLRKYHQHSNVTVDC